MRVQIDEAGCDDQPSCIDLACRGRTGQTADRDDPIRADSHIPGEPRIARAVDDAAAANQKVIDGLASADEGQAGHASDRQDDEPQGRSRGNVLTILSVAIVAIFDYCYYFRL